MKDKPIAGTWAQAKDMVYIATFIITVVSFWFGLSNKIDLLSQKFDGFNLLYSKLAEKVDGNESRLTEAEKDIIRLKSNAGIPVNEMNK